MRKEKAKRIFGQKLKLYDAYYKRSGMYKFILKNTIKMLIGLSAIVAFIFLLNYILMRMGINMTEQMNTVIASLETQYVLSLFFASESILGWIPPDFFIVWGKAKPTLNTNLNIFIFATISYAGGIVAYWLGYFVRKFPKVNNYIERKDSKYFTLIQKYGGWVFVFAALFPLPYATTSTVAGMVKYPFKPY